MQRQTNSINQNVQNRKLSNPDCKALLLWPFKYQLLCCICVSIDGYYTSSLRAVSLQCIPHADMQGQARRFQGHVPRGPPYCCSQGLILLSYFSSSFSYNGSLLAVLKHKSFHYSWLTVLKLSMFCYFCFPPVGCSGQH